MLWFIREHNEVINLLVELLHSVLIHEIIRNNWCLIYDISSPEIRRSDQSWPRHKILHCPYCEHVCRWALSYLLIISNSGCYLLIITCGRQDVIMSHWWIANYSTEKYQCWLSVPSPSPCQHVCPGVFITSLLTPHLRVKVGLQFVAAAQTSGGFLLSIVQW